MPKIKSCLEAKGHKITLPNSFDDPLMEEKMRGKGASFHSKWKGEIIKEQGKKIRRNDAILVLNFKKNNQPNYIGGATFLEMFKAFELGKKIFLFNSIPEGMLRDEIQGFGPTIINGNLKLVK